LLFSIVRVKEKKVLKLATRIVLPPLTDKNQQQICLLDRPQGWLALHQCDRKIREKIAQFLESSQKSLHDKNAQILEGPEHLYQNTF
jgi:hypothetical protein